MGSRNDIRHPWNLPDAWIRLNQIMSSGRLLQFHQNKVQVFISSAMVEFKEHRALIHSCFNRTGNMYTAKAWVFEFMCPNGQHDEKVYLDGVRQSEIFVMILSSDVRPAVIKEYEEAKKNRLKILVFVKCPEDIAEVKKKLPDLPTCNATWTSAAELSDALLDCIDDQLLQAFHSQNAPVLVAQPLAFIDAPPIWQAKANEIANLCATGEHENALLQLKNLILLGNAENNTEVMNLQAFVYRRKGDFNRAVQLYRQLFSETGRERFRIGEANAHLISGDLHEAETILQSLGEDGIKHYAFNSISASLAYQLKNFPEALRLLNASRTREARVRLGQDYWRLRASTYSELGLHFRAYRAHVRSALVSTSGMSIDLICQAHELWHLASESQSSELLETALALVREGKELFDVNQLGNGEHFEDFVIFTAMTEAVTLQALNRLSESETVLAQIDARIPDNAYIQFNRALLNRRITGADIPDDILVRFIEANPNESIRDNLWCRHMVAWLNGESDGKQALAYTKELGELHPNSATQELRLELVKLFQNGSGDCLNRLQALIDNSGASLSTKINAASWMFQYCNKVKDFNNMTLVFTKACANHTVCVDLFINYCVTIYNKDLPMKGTTVSKKLAEAISLLPNILELERFRNVSWSPVRMRVLGSILATVGANQSAAYLDENVKILETSLSKPEMDMFLDGLGGGMHSEEEIKLLIATR